jgi:hypothetical protein
MVIDIVTNQIIDNSEHTYEKNNVTFIGVRIQDIESYANKMKFQILDTSWIAQMSPLNQQSYSARANETIKSLVNNVLNEVKNSVTAEFGEILISMSAQDALSITQDHHILPLSELWKTRVRGNDSFDFHTETKECYIVFGEAKYQTNKTSYNTALKQVVRFINLRKDDMDLADLMNLVTAKTKSTFETYGALKSYAAAFSVKNLNNKKLIKQIKENKFFKQLMRQYKLYLIGIEICQ